MTHLSSEQMSDWILGERTPDVERHLHACGQCDQEVVRLERGLLAFKQSVHTWAEQSPVHPALQVSHAASPRLRLGWAAASVAAMGAILLPLYMDVRQTRHRSALAQDSLLLDEVNTRLARTVPRSMEHLMKLMNEGKEGPQ
jgi:hypothetical protein